MVLICFILTWKLPQRPGKFPLVIVALSFPSHHSYFDHSDLLQVDVRTCMLIFILFLNWAWHVLEQKHVKSRRKKDFTDSSWETIEYKRKLNKWLAMWVSLTVNNLAPSVDLQTITVAGLTRCADWYNSDVNVIEATNHFLVGSKACSMRTHSWLH